MTNEEALKNLLLDKDFLKLKNDFFKPTFNPFDVLNIARTEIRHSNVLAWLLNPNENHRLSSSVLKGLAAHLVESNLVDNNDAFKLLTMKGFDFFVQREWRHIDILVVSETEKLLFCIENKVDTQDHSDQLDRYVDTIDEVYPPDFTKLYLYLTPDGSPPNNDSYELWKSIKYEDIVNILEKAIANIPAQSDQAKFINSYLDILRREMMDNTELLNLCKTIYDNNKQALDLLFEYRPDKTKEISDIIKKWCEGKNDSGVIHFEAGKSSKNYIRFHTDALNAIIEESKTCSIWKFYYHYCFEIQLSQTKNKDQLCFEIALMFNSNNLEGKDKERIEECITKKFGQTLTKKWQYKKVLNSKKVTISLDEYYDNETIFDYLDNMFKDLTEKINKKL